MSRTVSRASLLSAIILIAVSLSVGSAPAAETRVTFDVPDKIECQDVTPVKCGTMHPHLRVIEAKFRISASFAEGSEDSIVDFSYMITSPQMRLKILDYLPNTTLESRYAEDRITVADFTEEKDTLNTDAKVAYQILSLGAGREQLNHKTEQNQYQRIAPKSLVLASGTMNRGHGVFYKLRPSNGASLEGAKEFTFLAIVPRDWRGDWCTFVCYARANKKSLLGKSVETAGLAKIDVGLYVCGDTQASQLADQLCTLQSEDDGALARQLSVEAAKALDAEHANSSAIHLSSRVDDLFHHVARMTYISKSSGDKVENLRHQVVDVEQSLQRLSGSGN